MAEPVKIIVPFKLLSAHELKNLPPPQWLLLDLFTLGSFAVLYGPSGVGKSFLALDFALSISSDAVGLATPIVQGLVVYIAAEGQGGLKNRVTAWEKTYCDSHNIWFLPEAVNFLQDLDPKRLLLSLRNLPTPPSLIIVDTMARCMLGGDENSSEAVGRLIARLDDIRKEFNSTILLVHHGTKSDDNIERGSSALRGAADTMLCLSGAIHNLILTCEKQKDAAEFEPIFLRLETVELANGEASCVLRPTGKPSADKLEAACLAVLEIVAEKQPCSHAVMKAQFMDTAGRTKSTFDRALGGLLERGSVVKGVDGKYSLAGG